MTANIKEYIALGLFPFNVPLPINLNDYANENYFLTKEASSIEGRWSSFPYQIGPLNWLGNDDIEVFTWRKAARVGYSKIVCASIVYHAEHKNRDQTVYHPTENLAIKFNKKEIKPLYAKIPALRGICKVDPYKRSSHHTTTLHSFIGSTLEIFSGKAAANYRADTKDIVYYEELAAFSADVEGEGAPTTLGDTRLQTSSFPKSVRGSTPKIKDSCLISASLAEADVVMHRFVPCPQCGVYQVLKWRNEKTKEYCFDFDTNAYICQHNGCVITYDLYPEMDEKGQWRSTDGSLFYDDKLDQFFDDKNNVAHAPRHIGVELPSMYSRFLSWEQLIREWKDATAENKRTGDFTKLKSFINTRLGEPWEDRGQRVEVSLYNEERLEPQREYISNGVVFITMWCDVQGGKNSRLEYEVVGWGVGKESWSLGYGIIRGEPTDPHVWDGVDKIRATKFNRQDGVELGISCCGVDSGYLPDSVYNFTRPRQRQRVYATKGYSEMGKPIASGYSYPLKDKKTRLYMVGDDTAKEILFNRLNKINSPGSGFCHFPSHYTEDYFKQLTESEEKVLHRNKRTGKKTYVFKKIKGRRNEALDCRVGNMAMLEIVNPRLDVLHARLVAESARINKNLPIQAVLQQRRRVRSKGVV